MSDPLKVLKEKMAFDESACRNTFNETEAESEVDPLIIWFHSARSESNRLQFIVLKEVGELVEALEFYASEKNWFGPGAPFNEDKTQKMIIASVDTEGNNWLGGRTARKALAKFGGGKGDS